jgi:hypothetical protein
MLEGLELELELSINYTAIKNEIMKHDFFNNKVRLGALHDVQHLVQTACLNADITRGN